ncbi:hypothetical protein Vspart_04186 [Vibrio spartinae]|uniref:Uncharacterized protein n=1 Tax=Vibrio spartinae TaxID=1918945 RepID=A0ABX6R6N1_9VIBR|nr:hypothetical protein Vspart_04186 [Vibrio spartinae]
MIKCYSRTTSLSIFTQKKANHKIVIGYQYEQNRFTNNVSWLGDPRLNKGHDTYCSMRANF